MEQAGRGGLLFADIDADGLIGPGGVIDPAAADMDIEAKVNDFPARMLAAVAPGYEDVIGEAMGGRLTGTVRAQGKLGALTGEVLLDAPRHHLRLTAKGDTISGEMRQTLEPGLLRAYQALAAAEAAEDATADAPAPLELLESVELVLNLTGLTIPDLQGAADPSSGGGGRDADHPDPARHDARPGRDRGAEFG